MKNYHYQNLPTMDALLELKAQLGISIGLGLPVLNEEATIGRVVECARSCQPLIDKIMVFDSGSTDRTSQICKQLRVPFISDAEAAKTLSVTLARGKGWNLWSSLYYLDCDVVGWIDTDIENIHTRFILGILAPLLLDPQTTFVKAYYKRPKGDARVTEILARPFLNLIFPEAAEFIQPLSGEYAGRRIFLESATFYSGYSVEIALLLQAILEQSPENVAQVYLDQRIHPLQDVPSLGLMASSILYTLMRLAQRYGRLKMLTDIRQHIKRFGATIGNGDDISTETISIADVALPPMRHQRMLGK
ncbi:MAG: glycosyltransferase [Candidatus Buchananbacteria bacterium]|nr:glycosyltransferase [Candidatus Buchananbacteria bacterium]